MTVTHRAMRAERLYHWWYDTGFALYTIAPKAYA